MRLPVKPVVPVVPVETLEIEKMSDFIFLRANGFNPPAADEPCSMPCLTLHLLSDIFHKH
jgi:hypothetical protein